MVGILVMHLTDNFISVATSKRAALIDIIKISYNSTIEQYKCSVFVQFCGTKMSVFNILKLLFVFSFLMKIECFPFNQYEYNEEQMPENYVDDEPATSEEKELYFEHLKKLQAEDAVYLDIILRKYYENFVEPYLEANVEYLAKKFRTKSRESKYSKIFDEIESEDELREIRNMQADMPETDSDVKGDSDSLKIMLSSANQTTFNLTSMIFNGTSLAGKKNREKILESALTKRTRNEWLDLLKLRVLEETGRKNNTGTLSPEVLEQFRNSLNGSVAGLPLSGHQHRYDHVNGNVENSEYSEKVRSFYPSCEMPRNTDEEVWKDMNTMNLFFNVDYNRDSASGSGTGQQNPEDEIIASAVLRLYRLPMDGNATLVENCQKSDNSHSIGDEDKQIRVSVYWYARSLKKHKAVKRRLADSRMVSLNAPNQYVEFNIRPATKSWVKGRNLGLGIIVEDMDGTILPAEKHFKGINCDTQPQNQFQAKFSTRSETPQDLATLLTVLQQLPLITIRLCPN
ncbi:hypothetical protein CBL_13135 [Carabus blaptoides fortunei]